MNNNYKCEKVSGWLNHSTFTYSLMRVVGIFIILFVVWITVKYNSDASEVSLISNGALLLLGIYFLFPKYTGYFKQREFVSIEGNMLTWNLDDIENIKSINLKSINKIRRSIGSSELLCESSEIKRIPIHRIHDKTKLDEFLHRLDNLSK